MSNWSGKDHSTSFNLTFQELLNICVQTSAADEKKTKRPIAGQCLYRFSKREHAVPRTESSDKTHHDIVRLQTKSLPSLDAANTWMKSLRIDSIRVDYDLSGHYTAFLKIS